MAFRFGPCIGAALLLASSAASAVDADAAARLDAWLAGLDTLSARFEQRLFDEDRNLLDQASGTMLIDRPGRFRFDYEAPPQLIVGDGARVWIYDPELAQVTVRDLDAALGSTPAVLLTSDRPVEDTFRIEAPAHANAWSTETAGVETVNAKTTGAETANPEGADAGGREPEYRC